MKHKNLKRIMLSGLAATVLSACSGGNCSPNNNPVGDLTLA